MSKKIKVGFDFDGVIAYNPLRVARFPVTLFKRVFLPGRQSKFIIPEKSWQKWIWMLLHKTSFLPARGLTLLKQSVAEGVIEPYLITGRFGYLERDLRQWLDKHKVKQLFKEVHLNKKNEQPHEFKKKKLEKLKLDYYLEDNWDIVSHLKKQNFKTRVYWISNFMDFFISYENKYPHLKHALEDIIKNG